jgi:NAD(P)-dependent dehydrogenase (short-subunit alcohol dehydrogenase family)
MNDRTIMIIGLGDLGGIVLELLARQDDALRIVVGSRSADRALARCNLARVGAIAQGRQPEIIFERVDLDEPETIAEAVQRHDPNLILTTATMHTWWLTNLLPPEPATLIKSAGFGAWLPVHLAPTRRLMQALKEIDYAGFMLTAPYPDVVNPILRRLGLTPTCGVGNVDEIVPKVRDLAARKLGAPLESIRVSLVAHHALVSAAYRGATDRIPPHHLRIFHHDEDVTQRVDAEALLLAAYPFPPGRASHFLTAGCIVRLIRAFFADEAVSMHTPAPDGLPGGYPVLVSRAGILAAPIPDLTLDEAIAINERSHVFDGIERIEEDGTVIFAARSVEIMRDVLGYECDHLPPEEAEDRAHELIARFRALAERHGVDLPQ